MFLKPSKKLAACVLSCSFFEHYINNNLYLAQKYAQMFVHEHYLFQDVNSLLRMKPEEKLEEGQIYKHSFAQDRGFCVFPRILQ